MQLESRTNGIYILSGSFYIENEPEIENIALRIISPLSPALHEVESGLTVIRDC